MSRFLASTLLATAVQAQHHHDPFAGSGCNCSTFCDNKCAINASKPANLTLYRMTPFGVLDLGEKNTADIAGDVSFIISRRSQAAECKKNPASFGCNTMVQFEGDDPDSTDLVLTMQVEIDGNWGPYLYCNDVNASQPLGAWNCTTTLDNSGSVPNYPAQCKADNYAPYPHLCFTGFPSKKQTVSGFAECCGLASDEKARSYTLNKTSLECSVFRYPLHYESCVDGVSGNYEEPEHPCNCERVFETTGLENITQAFGSYGSKYYPAGGLWFSHPHRGECKDGHYVGDGSGCTYRHVQTTSAVNASCVYNHMDTAIEKQAPSCFSTCPPNNRSTDCYNDCYAETVQTLSATELIQPFAEAVGAAGCPQVDLSHLQVPAHQKPTGSP